MENADVSKMIKNRRAGTFGQTPQAGTPIKRPVPVPPVKKTVAPVQMAPAKEETAAAPTMKTEQKSEIVKGFTMGISADGQLKLEFTSEAPNYLELIALFDYTNIKKQEILEQLANSGSVATRLNLVQLTNTTNQLAKGLEGLVEELVHMNDKVDTLYNTFIPESEPACTEG